MSQQEAQALKKAAKAKKKAKKKGKQPKQVAQELEGGCSESVSLRLARRLQELTGLESRVTSLGHLQRGGTPTPADRLLATRLGTACAELVEKGKFGVMVAVRGDECVPIPLEEIAGHRRVVPLDHPWIRSARLVGTSFGD